MAIGTSLGAYFDDAFHHQAGINTDPSIDRMDVDPEVDSESTKPKPKLDIMKVSDTGDDTAATMASRATEMAADALKSARGTLPSLDSDTGIKGDVIVPASESSRKLGIDTAITSDDRDTALALGPGFMGNGLIGRQYLGAVTHAENFTAPDYVPNLRELKNQGGNPAFLHEVESKSTPTYEQRFGMTPEQAANQYHNLPSGDNIRFAHHYEEHSAPHEWEQYESMVNDPLRQVPLEHGPSPFEQVASAARRARPEDETDRALRAIHEALYPEGRTLADREATASNLFRQEGHETYDELMARLDRQDQARMDATPTNQFKDYGKVQVADRGYGSFLFKAGDSKVLPLRVMERENGKLLYVNWIGDQSGRAINSFDKGTIKGLFKALADKYPNAEEVAGFRVSGARARSGSTGVARMRIPGRGKTTPPRKSIDQLITEFDEE